MGIIAKPTYKALNPDYAAVLRKAQTEGFTLPDAKTQQLGMLLIQQLKAAGVWKKLDVLYIFATSADCSNFARINWKSPANHMATLVNTPTFTAKEGIKGNGSDSYIDTNFNPSTHGSKYTLNDASRYAYINEVTGITGSPFEGALSTVGLNSMSFTQNNTGASKINHTTIWGSAFNYTIAAGMKSIHRTSSTNCTLFNNKTGGERTATVNQVLDENQSLGKNSTVYSPAEFSMYAMGASLVSENDAFVDAFTNYLTQL